MFEQGRYGPQTQTALHGQHFVSSPQRRAVTMRSFDEDDHVDNSLVWAPVLGKNMPRDCNASSGAALSRRGFVGAAAAAVTALGAQSAEAKKRSHKGSAEPEAPKAAPSPATTPSLAAKPPEGFVPMSSPGLVVKVSKSNTLQPNQLWPTEQAARVMLARVMTELTGESDLGKAFARFVHPGDKVAVKLNGIGAQKGATMGTNKELVLEVVKGLLAAGIPASDVWVFEQYPSFLAGTRVRDSVLPAGVKTYTHNNEDATMSEIRVAGIGTKFVRQLLEATAVINMGLIKDHSICGYTGALKNMTHGCVINPHGFHAHGASPQIALLYAQDAIKSRVRLHITDGYKVIYNGGPLDKDKNARVPHEAVYASTDPVALDVVGWQVVDKWRKDKNLPTLEQAKREPTYIRIASELGLGIADLNRIRLREAKA